MRAADGDERHGPFLPKRGYEDEAQCDINPSLSPLLKHYRCWIRPITLSSGSCSRCKAAITPKGANRRFCAGWPICTTWSRISVAPSMPGSVEWKSKEAQSRHETGSSTCRSSRREAFDEQWYSLPLNRVECGNNCCFSSSAKCLPNPLLSMTSNSPVARIVPSIMVGLTLRCL